MSKKLYYQVGGYTRDLRVYEDWDLKLRLAGSSAKWHYSDYFGTVYMQHSAGLSKLSRIRNIQNIITMHPDLIDRYLEQQGCGLGCRRTRKYCCLSLCVEKVLGW